VILSIPIPIFHIEEGNGKRKEKRKAKRKIVKGGRDTVNVANGCWVGIARNDNWFVGKTINKLTNKG
jgi:hypothetical protein